MGEGFPFTYSAPTPSFVVHFASVQGTFFLHTTHAYTYIYITVLPMNHSCPLKVICFYIYIYITRWLSVDLNSILLSNPLFGYLNICMYEVFLYWEVPNLRCDGVSAYIRLICLLNVKLLLRLIKLAVKMFGLWIY